MNRTILKKAIEELSMEKPRIDYLKGLLETLYELTEEVSSSGKTTDSKPVNVGSIPTAPAPLSADESAALDALAKSKLEFVKQGSTVE